MLKTALTCSGHETVTFVETKNNWRIQLSIDQLSILRQEYFRAESTESSSNMARVQVDENEAQHANWDEMIEQILCKKTPSAVSCQVQDLHDVRQA